MQSDPPQKVKELHKKTISIAWRKTGIERVAIKEADTDVNEAMVYEEETKENEHL